MDAFPGSTIAALCYRRETAVDVHRLAAELSRAVSDTEEARLDRPAEDFALCEAPDMRIGLAQVALNHAFPGCLTGKHYPTCVVLSVGPGGRVPEEQAVARYARVHADLVSRVQDVAAADRILVFERAGPYDRDLHDIVVDDIRGHLDKLLGSHRAPVADIKRAAPFAHPVTHIAPTTRPDARAPRAVDASQPDDIFQGLATRLEAELDRLEETRRALEVAGTATGSARAVRQRTPRDWRLVVAHLIPDRAAATLGLFGAPAKHGAADDAYPDYDHMPANVDERPLLHRAAVNALNVSVMTIALPVGAALLTMAVLGREDMLFSSRVTAVTGIGVALSNTGVVERLFPLLS